MVIFCDFDGTVTINDNIINIMKYFNPPGWETIKNDTLAGKMSVREGVGHMFLLLPTAYREEIVHYAIKQAKIRAGFDKFIQFCQDHNIRLLITSGGIDFFVYPILSAIPHPQMTSFAIPVILAANKSKFYGLFLVIHNVAMIVECANQVFSVHFQLTIL